MFIKGENNEQSIFSPIGECFNSCRKGEKNGDIGGGGWGGSVSFGNG